MKTALLVIDYINGIMDGSCKAYAAKHPIVEKVNHLIFQAREKSIPIYFIRLAFDNHYTDLPKHSKVFTTIRDKGLFKIGNNDTEFVAELNIQADDQVINKTAVSPFCGNNLMKKLKADNIERLVFAGVATDNAINLGVREAHDAGFYTVIVKDTCGASSEEFHNYALMLLEKIANEVTFSDDIKL